VKTLNEESAIQNMNQNCTNVVNYQFNPIEKIIELYERLLKVQEENIQLKKKQP